MSQQYILTTGEMSSFDIMSFLPLVLIFVIFYFLLLRPQQKKMRQHQEMLSKIRRGDRVATNGGLIGVVARVEGDREIILEIADNVRVRVLKAMVSDVLAKAEPYSSSAASEAKPAQPTSAASSATVTPIHKTTAGKSSRTSKARSTKKTKE